jgi:probable HAF family extracellular repeat protein
LQQPHPGIAECPPDRLQVSRGRNARFSKSRPRANQFWRGIPTHLTSINASGQIVGYFSNGAVENGIHHGFLYSGGTYTTIDPPGSTYTDVYSINASGEIVGSYQDASVGASHGFVDNAGTYTTLDAPGATQTNALAINDLGHVAGTYTDSNGQYHGFLESGGTYTSINFPNSAWTAAYSINDSDQVAGIYVDTSGREHSFLYSDGTYTTIDPAGSTSTQIPIGYQPINASGQIVGTYNDATGGSGGFLSSPSPVTEALKNDTGSSPTDKITMDPTLTGSGVPNAVVSFTIDKTASATTVTADSNGNWVYSPTGLADGQHTIIASETDAAGNNGTASLTFTLDTHAPVVTENLAHDTGPSSTDKITSNASLSGTGDPNAVVHFTVDGVAIDATATADSTGAGAWTFTPAGLADGAHTVIATEVDAAGNKGTAALTFTLDTKAPVASFGGEVPNTNGTVTLTGTSEANSSVTIFDGSTQIVTTADANGSWSVTTAKLSSSVHTFSLTSTDLAGNKGPGSGDAYYGSTANDTIVGTAGNDLLMGGSGGDKLTGGPGSDTFIYKNISDSQPTGNKFDTITDFVHNSDKIDFSAISGLNNSVQSVAVNVINGNAPASIAAHTIDIVVSGSNTTIYANASGSSETINNGHEDMAISLTGVTNVSSTDFILHH